MDWLVS